MELRTMSNKRILIVVIMFSLLFLMSCGDKNSVDESEGTQNNVAMLSDGLGLTDFYTTDLDGNEVTPEIFEDYNLTLVNVWGTFCSPCLNEMPDLGELHRKYQGQGLNVIGIVIDVQDENLEPNKDQIQLAKEIVTKTNADYTHLLVSSEMVNSILNQFDAIPASFFVDSKGEIVSEFYIGSKSKEDWIDLIEKNMANQ